jgi:ribosome-associated heat shock protein Hsp15
MARQLSEPDGDAEGPGRVRLDKWLWAARFFKTRSQAAEAIEGGKVQVGGERAKRAKLVQAGDELRIRLGPYEHHVVVRAVSERRGPATVAAELYEETAASRAAREAVAAQLKASGPLFGYGQGKPSKKDRRAIDRLRQGRRRS